MSPIVVTAVGLMAAVVLLVGASAALLEREARMRELEDRVLLMTVGTAVERRRTYAGPLGVIKRLGDAVRRGTPIYSEQDLEQLRAMLVSAGYNPNQMLPLLLGSKLALTILLPVAMLGLGVGLHAPRLVCVFGALAGFVVGILGPDFLLGMVRRRCTAALDRATPDALDLLVVCTEAGMGLESAIDRVGQEMIRSSPAMGNALMSLLDDLRVLPDRRTAFQNLGRRTGVEGLQRMATILSQTLQLGTPLGQGLRAVAAELRRDRALRLEERAVKLPARLIIPMILFLMPSLYIVLLGPSMMQLLDTFRTLRSQTGH